MEKKIEKIFVILWKIFFYKIRIIDNIDIYEDGWWIIGIYNLFLLRKVIV